MVHPFLTKASQGSRGRLFYLSDRSRFRTCRPTESGGIRVDKGVPKENPGRLFYWGRRRKKFIPEGDPIMSFSKVNASAATMSRNRVSPAPAVRHLRDLPGRLSGTLRGGPLRPPRAERSSIPSLSPESRPVRKRTTRWTFPISTSRVRAWAP